ncbi:AraC family ligand binding domain-containing protein [Myxococcus sp. K15C18031901]|uniref:AraC family ligand binding domain-containing protein n=1 Tax=Myxococcus dinghuensis TaxID=2906761 RepID=UPI0020A7408B|nr:AraC family ligand binding domain-containing protein [Myxococcus dinghuensis]MCP3101871.1 AraC family ligand binding domain-containing protein [Myxococcus dinghuensis]
MVTEWEGYATSQVWRPVAYPGLVLYRVSGLSTSQALHVHDELQLTLDAGHVQQVSFGAWHLTAPPGSLVVIPPGELHALHSEGGRPGVLYGMLVPTPLLGTSARPRLDGEEPLFPSQEEGLIPGSGAVLEDPEVARVFVELHRALRGVPSTEDPRFAALLADLLSRLRKGSVERAPVKPGGPWAPGAAP